MVQKPVAKVCTMASNVGLLHASVEHHFGQAEVRHPETSWPVPFGHKTPKDLYMRSLHVIES